MKHSHRAVLEMVAQQHIPDDLNLLPQIVEKLEKKTLKRSLRTRPMYALLLLLLALSIISGVAYAIGRQLGYVPGVGIVEDSSGIYILAESVSARDRDIDITVSQVIADSTRTFITYRIDGISPTNPGLFTCTVAPVLELPDGNKLSPLSGGAGNMESYNGETMAFETSYIFPPVPAQTTKVILISSSPCAEITMELNLIPAPIDFATPVTEIESGSIPLSSKNSTEFSQSSLPTTPTPVSNGSGLYLEKALETESSYILIGTFTDNGDLPGSLVMDVSYRIKAYDEEGNRIPVNSRNDIRPNIIWGGIYSWAYEIPKPITGTITLTLEQINIRQSDTFQFQIDTGGNPQIEDKWVLNLPFTLFENHYVIDSVEVLEKGYRVRLHTDDKLVEGTDIILSMPDIVESTLTGSEIHRENQVRYEQDILIDGSLPSGLQTFEFTVSQIIPLQGPWTLEWAPPSDDSH